MPNPDPSELFLQNDGYCVICNALTSFEARFNWLRDHYKCTRCGTIPRQRALVYFLSQIRPNWRVLEIHESSPSLGYFRNQCANYSHSFYFEDILPGTYHDGNRCENLESLTFADDSFDIFITQDVLEHVFHPDQVLSEISRVLREGGMHIFTAPKHKHLVESCRRAQLENGEIVYLKEPEYHGNPISEKGSLVTWDYGADFDDLIGKWSDFRTSCYVMRDRYLGIDGEYLDVFVTQKQQVNRTSSG